MVQLIGMLSAQDQISGKLSLPMKVGGGSEIRLQTKSVSYVPSESAQSDLITYNIDYDGLDKVNVSIEAVSSGYIGSDVPRRSSSDLSVEEATITAPAGYYAESVSTSLPIYDGGIE